MALKTHRRYREIRQKHGNTIKTGNKTHPSIDRFPNVFVKNMHINEP